jgi:hypothetical protein
MENQVKETGTERLSRLRAEAKTYKIVGQYTADVFEIKIAEAKAAGVVPEQITLESTVKSDLSTEERDAIIERLKFEEETRAKFRRDREILIEVAAIKAESESLKIKIDLPDNPTELELAKARQALGIQKKEIKPSPETLAIEASPRGYYEFTNRGQEDASHTVNPGGKYYIDLIPDVVIVLSEWHIKFFKLKAVRPIYGRVSTGVIQEGRMGEECRKTGSKPRFAFEYLGKAPDDAPFGLVLDTKILDELKPKEVEALV